MDLNNELIKLLFMLKYVCIQILSGIFLCFHAHTYTHTYNCSFQQMSLLPGSDVISELCLRAIQGVLGNGCY